MLTVVFQVTWVSWFPVSFLPLLAAEEKVRRYVAHAGFIARCAFCYIRSSMKAQKETQSTEPVSLLQQ